MLTICQRTRTHPHHTPQSEFSARPRLAGCRATQRDGTTAPTAARTIVQHIYPFVHRELRLQLRAANYTTTLIYHTRNRIRNRTRERVREYCVFVCAMHPHFHFAFCQDRIVSRLRKGAGNCSGNDSAAASSHSRRNTFSCVWQPTINKCNRAPDHRSIIDTYILLVARMWWRTAQECAPASRRHAHIAYMNTPTPQRATPTPPHTRAASVRRVARISHN